MELYLDKPKFTMDEDKDGGRFVKLAVPMSTLVGSAELAQQRMAEFWDLIGHRLIVHLQKKEGAQVDWVAEQERETKASTRIAVLEAKLREWESVGANVKLLLGLATSDPQVPLDRIQREGCVLDVNQLRRLAKMVEYAQNYAEPDHPMEGDEAVSSNEEEKAEVWLPELGSIVFTPQGEGKVIEVLYGDNGQESQVLVRLAAEDEASLEMEFPLSGIYQEAPTLLVPECEHRTGDMECTLDDALECRGRLEDGTCSPPVEGETPEKTDEESMVTEQADEEEIIMPMKARSGANPQNLPRMKIWLRHKDNLWRYGLSLLCHHQYLTDGYEDPSMEAEECETREWALYAALKLAITLAFNVRHDTSETKVMQKEANRIMTSVEAYRAEYLPNSDPFEVKISRPGTSPVLRRIDNVELI
jgi:hypothetical protein